MKLTIYPSPSNRGPPSLPELHQTEEMWQLNLTPYAAFISDVTGVKLTETSSPDAIKTVQSRLEGCIESYTHNGECKCRDLGEYDRINSVGTVRKLAQFFRVAAESEEVQLDLYAT